MAGHEFAGILATVQRVVEAAGAIRQPLLLLGSTVRESSGIEPFSSVNPNPLMANDIGFHCVKTLELPRRLVSPGFPYSPLEFPPCLKPLISNNCQLEIRLAK